MTVPCQPQELQRISSPSAAQLAEELILVQKVVTQKDRQIRRLQLDVEELQLDVRQLELKNRRREFDHEDHDAEVQVQIVALEAEVNRLENDAQMSKKDTELIELKTAYCELERRHNDLVEQRENEDSQNPDTSIEEQEYDQSQTLQPTSQAMSDIIESLDVMKRDLEYTIQTAIDSLGNPEQRVFWLAGLNAHLAVARELLGYLIIKANQAENGEETRQQDLESTPELTSATTVTSVSNNGDNDSRYVTNSSRVSVISPAD